MRKLIAGAVTALMLVPAAAYSDQPAQSVTLASDNSGLLAAILPGFTRATGISVRVLALSTNQALDLPVGGTLISSSYMIPWPSRNFSTT